MYSVVIQDDPDNGGVLAANSHWVQGRNANCVNFICTILTIQLSRLQWLQV